MNFFKPGPVRVKICGITNKDDARMAIAAGADALGFNFFPGSKRYLEPEEAIPWISDLFGPEGAVERVAVVVNPEESLLEKIRTAGCFEAIQFHGDESPAFCEQAGFPVWIKAVRVRDRESLVSALDWNTPHILLDAWSAGAFGGTGKQLDWDLAGQFAIEQQDRQFILAGGLDVQNICMALRALRVHAVDVASGVESSPRKKDEALVRKFISLAGTG